MPYKIVAVVELGMNLQGYSKSNKPWTPQNKSMYGYMMNLWFKRSKTVYSSAPDSHESKHQPGGNTLTINGHSTGCIADRGSDKMSHFCWYALQEI